MPKIGPQLVAIKRSRYPNRTVTTLIEQSIIQSIVEHWSLLRLFCCSVRVGILLIGVEWLQEVAVTFFLVFTLIWGPPKIILPRAPQSVRPGLTDGVQYHSQPNNLLILGPGFSEADEEIVQRFLHDSQVIYQLLHAYACLFISIPLYYAPSWYISW